MSNEQKPGDRELREIASKIREMARQTRIAKARQELFDLADSLDRMAALAQKSRD